MRARVEIETDKHDRETIVVTELPYQVNKAALEKIAELVRDKKITGIGDLRDESDREGMRVVIEVKRGEAASFILNQLYKHTALQSTFGVILLALVDNQPRLLTLRDLLGVFLRHRHEIVVRRTAFALRKAEERAHVLEGFRIALDNLDAVIALIRGAADPETARAGLVERFGLSQIQAQAILDLKLQRLTGLEREKILEERRAVLSQIEGYKAILGSDEKVRGIIRDELKEIQETYGDDRRTVIVPETTTLGVEDLIAPEEMVITISNSGYAKRNPLDLYRAQRRGGKGKIGMETRERLRPPPLHGVHARLYPLLHGYRPGPLAQGPPASRSGPGGQGKSARQSPADPAGGAGHSRPVRRRVLGQPVRRHGDSRRRHQEDAARGLRPPSRGRDHRRLPRRRRSAHPGRPHRRDAGRLPRDAGWNGDPFSGGPGARHGPDGPGRDRHPPAGRGRRGRDGARHGHLLHPDDHGPRIRQEIGPFRVQETEPGAASGSSRSRQRRRTAPSSASFRWRRTTRSS